MIAPVQLIFASTWLQLDGSCTATQDRELTHEWRCGKQIRLQRGQCDGHPAIWVDWSSPHAPTQLFNSHPRDHEGVVIAFAAAVEASPEASHWLLLLSHLPSPHSYELIEQRVRALMDNTMVTWRSQANELIAAGFSCEMYSELIRLDCAHALDRLLRRYPCLQMGDPTASPPPKEHSTSVNR